MSDITERILPLLLENRDLTQKGVALLQKAHGIINKKKKEDRTPEEWFVLGYYAQQVQQLDDAQAHYTQAVLKNPEFEAAYKFRAMVCIDTRQFEDAEYDLDKALELDPSYNDARFERARMYHEMDRDEDAIKELQELIGQDESYSDAHALIGSTYEKIGRYDEAVEAFGKAIEQDPENSHYYTQRGLAHYFANNYNEASDDLNKVHKLAGSNHITQFNLALVLGESDDTVKEAFRNFEKAFKRAPDMLNQFYEQAGKKERSRLDGRLDGLLKRLSTPGSNDGGLFYREQLAALLERKLREARNRAPSA